MSDSTKFEENVANFEESSDEEMSNFSPVSGQSSNFSLEKYQRRDSVMKSRAIKTYSRGNMSINDQHFEPYIRCRQLKRHEKEEQSNTAKAKKVENLDDDELQVNFLLFNSFFDS